ncbi:MAG: 2,3-bisphosphoglycerate-independent phosphoglycerate mutase, partial [Patescibacteria group bacterium]
HLLGLVGQGMVHSSAEHLYALLSLAHKQGVKAAYIHLITDGRDSPPKSAQTSVKVLQDKLNDLKIGTIASIVGRYYAMDRDKRWDRVERAYNALTKGSERTAKTAEEAITAAYEQSKTDEFIEPTTILGETGQPVLIKKGDAVIFFNYRIDRPRELTKAFVLDNFEKDANKIGSFDPYQVEYTKSHIKEAAPTNPPFKRGPKIEDLFFVTMTEYEKLLPTQIAFPPNPVALPLGKVLAERGIHQLRMSESEKERFVTYYFNGLRENTFPSEDRIIIPSPKVATYDKKPEMSAVELTDTLIKKLREQKYGFILVNYANADMVGHTGSIEASVLAIKTLDECLAKLIKAALIEDVTVLVTADHGNVEEKINPSTGEISTEHTSNPVPFIAISNKFQGRLVKLQTGILADVAPTILALLHIPKPSDMTGHNLLDEMD